jgi:hypothetical protein
LQLLVALLVAWVALQPVDAQAIPPEPPWGNGQSQAEDLQIKLVVFSPGNQVTNWFGHAALVVEDTRYNRSRLYNYGMFTFDTAMLVKFAMGRLQFWVGQQSPQATYDFYKSQERDVRIHLLDLPPAKRMELAQHLAWKVRPDNREYLYHHYFDNCSTRPRDRIDDAVGGALEELAKKPSPLTLREHTRRYTHHNAPMDLLLAFMMNDSIDQPIPEWDAMFLPDELEQSVKKLTYEKPNGEVVPLVKETRVYYEADRREIPDRAPAHWPWALLIGLLVGVGGVGLAYRWSQEPDSTGRRVAFGLHQTLVSLLLGVPGLLLFVMACGTDHKVTYWNENLFFASPITFLALPLSIMIVFGKTRMTEWLKWVWTLLVVTGLLGLVVKLLPMFDQQNRLPASFIYPMTLGCAAAFWLLERADGDE